MLSFDESMFKLFEASWTAADFEHWLYNAQDIEDKIGKDLYLEAISINYARPHALHAADKIFKPFIEFGDCRKRELIAILDSIINRSETAARDIEECYWLCFGGYFFLEDLAMEYGLKIIHRPNKYLDDFYPEILKLANQARDWIVSGQIIILPDDGDLTNIYERKFEDRR